MSRRIGVRCCGGGCTRSRVVSATVTNNASARIGAADGAWQLSLIGRNLTNKYYLLFAGDRTGGTSVPLTPGEQRGVVARGREVWLQASFRY